MSASLCSTAVPLLLSPLLSHEGARVGPTDRFVPHDPVEHGGPRAGVPNYNDVPRDLYVGGWVRVILGMNG